MSDPSAEIERKVEQASGGEPAADVSPEDADQPTTPESVEPDASTSSEDAPDRFNEASRKAESERIRSMQEEGKGIRGEATGGREDMGDEASVRDAAEGE